MTDVHNTVHTAGGQERNRFVVPFLYLSSRLTQDATKESNDRMEGCVGRLLVSLSPAVLLFHHINIAAWYSAGAVDSASCENHLHKIQ